jgi:hypothetical protein
LGRPGSGGNRPYTELPFSLVLRFRSRILQSIMQRTSRLNELGHPNFSRTHRPEPELSLKFQFQPLAIRAVPLCGPGGRDGGSQGPAQIFPEVANLEDSGWARGSRVGSSREQPGPGARRETRRLTAAIGAGKSMIPMGFRRFRRVRRFFLKVFRILNIWILSWRLWSLVKDFKNTCRYRRTRRR